MPKRDWEMFIFWGKEGEIVRGYPTFSFCNSNLLEIQKAADSVKTFDIEVKTFFVTISWHFAHVKIVAMHSK